MLELLLPKFRAGTLEGHRAPCSRANPTDTIAKMIGVVREAHETDRIRKAQRRSLREKRLFEWRLGGRTTCVVFMT